MKRVLISVSDKTGIVHFARNLAEQRYEIISTGGTLKTLLENDIKATAIADITGFPEIFEGRVKTLHPLIHGGLLIQKDNKEHLKQAKKHGIIPIDMLVVNLYPFENFVNQHWEVLSLSQQSQETKLWNELIENIDIGGPAMIRAGAKNYDHITVVVDPDDYKNVLSELIQRKQINPASRLKYAQKAFEHVSKYDKVIALVLESKISNIYPPKSRTILNLRYGENPHQKVAKFEFENDFIKQLHGKELSYNNLLDIDAALKTILRFDKTTVAILKHTNPCGIAQDDDLTYAFKKAFDTDTVSPFGGITVTNETVDVGFAEHLNTIFTEIIIAPYFEEEALKELKKKKDRRIIRYERNLLPDLANYTQTQTCINGVLSQEPDLVPDDVKQWTFPTQLKPSPKDIKELLFAWKVVRILKSNAIALTSKRKTLGLGFGQTSRIDSLNIAIERAGRMKLDLNGSYCASDGFFPFSDSIERLAEIGVKCIVQPGGSKADQDVINACDRHKIAMAFTGKRHFRH